MPGHSHRRTTVLLGLGLALSWGCTPLGMWVYEDPRFSLVEVRPDSGAGGQIQLLLVACNLNDYDLQTDSLGSLLLIENRLAGSAGESSSIVLPSRTAQSVMLHLVARVPEGAPPEDRVPFSVVSQVTVQSPIGPRHVVSREKGVMTMHNGEPATWTVKDPGECHPGTGSLPAAAGRGAPIVTPPPPPLPEDSMPVNGRPPRRPGG